MLYRQGDVLIRRINSIPSGLTPVPREDGRVILAHGEVTGHAHVVEGEVEFLATDLAEMQGRFLRVLADAQVVHDEHRPMALAPGCYEVIRQREYAPQPPQQPLRGRLTNWVAVVD